MEPHEWKTTWVNMFREECVVRTGNDYTGTDAEAFYQYYGSTPHQAVLEWMEKYNLDDIPAALGKTVWYVVADEHDESDFGLMENDPGEGVVLWIGTDQFEAESQLCKCCD